MTSTTTPHIIITLRPSTMADARSLLRAQRAARRIEHPHAQYTDSGKLTCTVCREAIKSEGLWETHTRSASHRQKFLAHQKAKARPQQQHPPPPTNGVAPKPKPSTDTLSDEALLAQIIGGSGAGQKRKHGEGTDVEMADAAPAGERDGEEEEEEGGDAVRKKRSRQDIGSPTATASIESAGMFSPLNHTPSSTTARNGSPMKTDSPPVGTPPPGLVRRSSGTPSHGVELQIPSRPATPSASAASSTSTPKATPIGRSPLIPQEAQMGAHPAVRQGPRANFVTSFPSAAAAADTPHSHNSTIATASTTEANSSTAAAGGADEDDWAAFEAEVVHAAPPTTTTKPPGGSTTTNPGTSTTLAGLTNSDAVISAAPLTAEQLAAKSEEEDRAKRRAAADIELEDEQEEAQRAMEAEFEEMEELEARVRKLKEKREAIRRGSVPATTTIIAPVKDATVTNGATGAGNDHNNQGSPKAEEDDSDDDDEEEEEEDDWAGFRFRG